MDLATAAVMFLLSCSSGEAPVCKPINTAPHVFASIDECRALLAETLASAPRREVVGRCQPVDPTVTGSVPSGYATVVVTRGSNAASYIVPHKE